MKEYCVMYEKIFNIPVTLAFERTQQFFHILDAPIIEKVFQRGQNKISRQMGTLSQ